MLNWLTRSLLATALWLLFSNANAYVLFGEDVKWGAPGYGNGASVTWSLMDTGIACDSFYLDCEESSVTHLSEFMPSGYLNEIRRAFATWSSIADITFNEIVDGGGTFGDNGNPASYIADIRIGGMYIDGTPYLEDILGYSYPPYTAYAGAGDIILDRGNVDTFGIGPGAEIDIFSLVLHELGHSIGIDHNEADPNAVMYPYYSFVDGLSQDDIAAAQKLYGLPVQIVPLPAAVWLLLSGLGFFSMNSRWQRSRKST